MIVLPKNLSPLREAIIRRAQRDIPILEDPIGSNRSPEIDALCRRFGVPLGSSWCALWAAAVWQDAGAEIPPIDEARGRHPATCETWRQWAYETQRYSTSPAIGAAVLYGAKGGPAHHIGACVVSITPILMDLEGNTALTGFSREGELTACKPIDATRVLGYVLPEARAA